MGKAVRFRDEETAQKYLEHYVSFPGKILGLEDSLFCVNESDLEKLDKANVDYELLSKDNLKKIIKNEYYLSWFLEFTN